MDDAEATVVKQRGDTIERPAQAVSPNPNEPSPAIDFLHTFLGEAPWPLVAISPTTRDIKAALFSPAPERDADADGWIKKFNDAGYGIYYGANPLKPDAPRAAKAKKDARRGRDAPVGRSGPPQRPRGRSARRLARRQAEGAGERHAFQHPAADVDNRLGARFSASVAIARTDLPRRRRRER